MIAGPTGWAFRSTQTSPSSCEPNEIARTRRETPVNTFVFGRQTVRTMNFMMAPAGLDRIEVDVVDYMWEVGR